MGYPQNPNSYLLLFFFFLQLLVFYDCSSAFNPVDNYLIDCGSNADTTVDVDNRNFVGDSSKPGSVFLSATRTISLRDQNPSLGSSPLYHTARVFSKPSSYEFEMKKKGTHLVRLHFLPFSSPRYNLSAARFHVSVHGFMLLSDFSGRSPVSKEFLIWVDSEKLVISFAPWKKSSLAFVNAIEVISTPEDLIPDTAQLVNSKGMEKFDGLTKQGLETVYRVNVGGPKVTPFNDSLWRTWIPDDGFLHLRAASKAIYSNGQIKYPKGGASHEIAPDSVYNTARVMNDPHVLRPNFNITWVFPVSSGFKYLVRMHFCDIVSESLNLLYFDVFINGYSAYRDLDLSRLTNEVLAAPYYADFVVDGDSSGVLRISIGPSSLSSPSRINAILNGLEIMKMSNSMGSLCGELSVDSVLQSWPSGKVVVLVPSVLLMSLLIAAFVSMYWKIKVKNSVAWSPVPMDVSEGNLKCRS